MSEMIEIRARALAAKKMNLEHDRYGSRLPDEVWQQALPEAIYAFRIEIMQRLRREFLAAPKQGYPVQDWQLAMWARWIDEFKAFESPKDRELRIVHTSPNELTESEIEVLDTLSPGAKDREAKRRAQQAREEACPGHEAEAEPVSEYSRMRGWHPAHCKHCGKDMSVDSGD
jgi:hypothetical protein